MRSRGVTIRLAASDDADLLSDLNCRTWIATYRGALPPAALEQGIIEREGWRDLIARGLSLTGERDSQVLLADCDGQPAGFAWAGLARASHGVWDGEVYMLYVLPEWQKRGVGRALLSECARHLVRRGLFDLGAWCVAGNANGRGFYRAMGGELSEQRNITMAGAKVPLVGYSWRDAPALLRLTAD